MQWWLSRRPPHSSCSHVFPSRRLSPTFIPRCFFTCCLRCDITAILLFAEHLMWSVCENPEELVPSCPPSAITTVPGASDWPRRIHSLCEELLTVLIIVTAPLSLLYRFVQADVIDVSRCISIKIPCVKSQKPVQVVFLPRLFLLMCGKKQHIDSSL